MKSADLQSQLIAYTETHCGHEEHRQYIGLSGIADCPAAIYDRYQGGHNPPLCERLKYAVGNELEASVKARLDGLGVLGPGRELVARDGLVKGHTDGELDGDLLEIKTLALEKYIPTAGHIPVRIYWQVQAYMHFGRYRLCHLLYLARDTGAIQVLPVGPNRYTQEAVLRKIDELVDAVRAGIRPACTCGHCP